MTKLLSQISTLIILSALLLSCGPSLPNKYPHAQVSKTEAGNILIVTEDFSAVIISKENMESFYGNPNIQYWTPTVKQILYLETNLLGFLSKKDAEYNSGHAPDKNELVKYGRQYFGVTTPDGRYIFDIFFCDPDNFDWKNRFVDVIGGGDCYFGIEFDPETLNFMNIYVHSPK